MRVAFAAHPAAPARPPEKGVRTPLPAPIAAKPSAKRPVSPILQDPPPRVAATEPPPGFPAPVAVALAQATAVSTVAAGPSAATAVPAESVSADGLRQYRIDLAVAARRFRMYPVVARARGWEGVAEVSISVSAGPAAPSLHLARSSGHAILDEQALQMLGRALESTPLPESLRGRSFVLPMPVRFSLEE